MVLDDEKKSKSGSYDSHDAYNPSSERPPQFEPDVSNKATEEAEYGGQNLRSHAILQ